MWAGIGTAALLVIVRFIHQGIQGFKNDRALLYFSVASAVAHTGFFAYKLLNARSGFAAYEAPARKQ